METAPTQLSNLVNGLLDLADVDMSSTLTEFEPCVQQWCPIITDEVSLGVVATGATTHAPRRLQTDQPIIALALWLLARRPCANAQHVLQCELHRTLKQVMALWQSEDSTNLMTLQLGMLLVTYELGHALHNAAFQTLASCVAILELLGLRARTIKHEMHDMILHWLSASVLMLDRMLPIAVLNSSLPLTLLPNHQVCKSVASKIGPSIPDHPLVPHATSPRKVHIRSVVEIASGHVLDYIHKRRHELEPERTYDQVNDIIAECIKILVDKPEPHTWLHCDAIAMAFCSHMLLQQAEMDHHSANMVHFSVPNSQYAKTHVALKYSRRMSWDMVVVAIQKVQTPAEISQLPLAGLSCVLRAGLVVLETQEYVVEDVVKDEEVQGFRQLLTWFIRRWHLGRGYIDKLEEVIGRNDADPQ